MLVACPTTVVADASIATHFIIAVPAGRQEYLPSLPLRLMCTPLLDSSRVAFPYCGVLGHPWWVAAALP